MFKPYADSFEFSDASVVYPCESYERRNRNGYADYIYQTCLDYIDDENAQDFVTLVEEMSDLEEGYNPTDEEVYEWAYEFICVYEFERDMW